MYFSSNKQEMVDQKCPGGTPIWKGWGCSSELLNQTTNGDGRGPKFFWPLKAIILNFDYMNRTNKTNWKYIIS